MLIKQTQATEKVTVDYLNNLYLIFFSVADCSKCLSSFNYARVRLQPLDYYLDIVG